MTRVLAIETSCDETSVAILDGAGDDVKLRSLVILSQDVHRIFGGVVPELASRAHLTAVDPVTRQALREADASLESVDLFAATIDRKSTRLNSSHIQKSRMPSSA